MNDELNKLQLEEFIEKSLLDIKSRLQDTLSVVIVQLDCSQNRKKRINITPLEDKTISIRDINKQISKEMKEKDHGTRTA